MSWTEAIKNGVQITTGDGVTYYPLTRIESFTGSFEFNISEFEFPEIEGTKVDRRLRKGVRYPLELFFQGDNCIQQGKAFIESSRDKRPWKVLHPVFGQFNGQPISIEFDSSGLNIFKITTTVVETILEDGAKTVFSPIENSKQIVLSAKESNAASFKSAINVLKVSDLNLMKSNVSNLHKKAIGSITDQDLFNKYTNLFNEVQTKIDSSLSEVDFGILLLQDFINYPASFQISVKSRLSLLKSQAIQMSANIVNFVTFNEKKIFENNKGELINAIIATIVSPFENDYQSAVDVYFVISEAIEIYNDFLSELQFLQSPNGFEIGSYLPDASFIEALGYAFNYAISNLFAIALTAQQQRVIVLEEDSNVIILAHRFYGLNPDDSTLNRFIETNNIGLSETYQIKKGRKIVYFI